MRGISNRGFFVESYKIQLFLHIAAAIVALGATFAIPVLHAWAERRGVGATRMALQFSEHMEKVLVIPGAVLVLLFGVGLIFDDATGYKDNFPWWLGVAIAWFVAAFAVAAFVQKANVERAIATLDKVEDDGDFPPAYMNAAARVKITGAVLAISTVAITFLMVWQPGE